MLGLEQPLVFADRVHVEKPAAHDLRGGGARRDSPSDLREGAPRVRCRIAFRGPQQGEKLLFPRGHALAGVVPDANRVRCDDTSLARRDERCLVRQAITAGIGEFD
jgi:hypothetical protein